MTNSRKFTVLSFIVVMAVAVALLFTTVALPTARAQEAISYIAAGGSEASCTNYSVVDDEHHQWSDGSWVVTGPVQSSTRYEVVGTVNLILCDGAALSAEAGISVEEGATLNIYGQSNCTGDLYIGDPGSGKAGIGGNENGSGGTVNIYGGIVTATGGEGAVAIGGGSNAGSHGTLTVANGMEVYGWDDEASFTAKTDYANTRWRYMVVEGTPVASTTPATPATHTHDDVTFTAWESTTSLPGSAGNYYLTADVTLSGAWTKPSGTVSICLNGHGIRTTSGRVITINGGTLNLYDCGDATHYFDVSGGKAVNVNDNSGANSFTGGYITGGVGKGGLGETSVYWNEGGGILVWSGTFNMYGGTILGNSASHGGGVEAVNATMNLYGGDIIYNTCGEGGSGINLRSQSGNTVTLNMYGGSVSYNKGTAIDQSYCYGNRYLNLYGGTVSHNTGHGVWITNATVNGDPVIEENGGYGMLFAGTCSLAGSPAIRNNTSGNVYVNDNGKITIAGALNADPIGVTMKTNTGVFTTGWSDYMMMDPADVFFSDKADYHVELAEGEAVVAAGGLIYVNDLQGHVKTLIVNNDDTIGDLKADAAELFGKSAAGYTLNYNGEDLLDNDTVGSCGIRSRDVVYFLPTDVATLQSIVLDPSITATTATLTNGKYTVIRQGETVTVTYKLVHNDGLTEMLLTTAFDEEYFRLKSITTDGSYYSLLNDYGYSVYDEQNQEWSSVELNRAGYIAAHNAKIADGDIDPNTELLRFFLSLKGTIALSEAAGKTTDTFLTVTYEAAQDIYGVAEFYFGLDMSENGAYTNAAADGDTLLAILYDDTKVASDKMVTLLVMGVTEVEIVEDQYLVLENDTVDTDDIALTWTKPVFTGNDNPYIADGGTVNYTFYTLENNEYVALNGDPTVLGDYYVKATLPDTAHYLGCETGYVAITVKGATEVEIVADQSIVLLIDTDDIELTWTKPDDDGATYLADGGEVTFTFYTKNGNNEYVPVVGNPTAVGDYYVKATLSDTAHYVGYTTEDYVAITVMGTTTVTIPEDQSITFKRFGDYYFDESALEKTWTPTGDPDPYLADGGEVTIAYYTLEGQTYVPIANTNAGHPAIMAAGTYYAKATLADTTHYVGSETGYVEFTVARMKTPVPELKLYAGETSATATGPDGLYNLKITMSNVTYGTTLTLKEIVNNEEVDYELPETYMGIIDDLQYFYQTGVSPNTVTCDNFFLTQPLTVGTYTLYIQPRDARYVEFASNNGRVDKIVVTVTIQPKALTVNTYIDEETEYELTYGDAAPAANLFTFTVEGALSDADAEAIRAALEVQAADTAYVQYAGAVDYVYTTAVKSGSTLNANYSLGTPGTAKIVVSPKALTLAAAYNGGTVTLTCGGIVNNDAIALTYSVDDVDLDANVYTATAADLLKEEIIAKVTTTSANYSEAELELNAVHSVTFAFTEAFSAATGLPATQYLFDGQKATEPADPAFTNHDFLYWTPEDEPYNFDTAVTQNVILYARWEKAEFDYKFRALNAGGDYATGIYRELSWDEGSGAFVLAEQGDPETFKFAKGDVIPVSGTIGNFRVASWVKAVKVDNEYEYTPVTTFEAAVSTEEDEDAYYIAIMTLDLGRGDVNGDGRITNEDVIIMQKILVGVNFDPNFFVELNSVATVWKDMDGFQVSKMYYYSFLFDVNGDGYKDTRDVLISRRAIATGYDRRIMSDVTVDGIYYSNQIIATIEEIGGACVNDEESLFAALNAGKKAFLTADIEIADDAQYPNTTRMVDVLNYDVYIELDGHALTVNDFQLKAKNGSLTVKNGTIGFRNTNGQIILASETGVYCSGVIHGLTGYEIIADGTEENIAVAAE